MGEISEVNTHLRSAAASSSPRPGGGGETVLFLTPAVTLPGLRAEEGLQQRPAGAQSHPGGRRAPEGGAGGEPEGLPEEGRPPGAAGGVSEGQRRGPGRLWGAQPPKGKRSGLFWVLQEELGAMQTRLSQLDAQRQRAPQEAERDR